MNHNEKPARIVVEIAAPDAEGRGDIDIELDGGLNLLLNGLSALTAHLLKDMMEDIGKDAAMHIYARLQTDALKSAGIDPRKEAEEDIKRIVLKAAFEHIFADGDPEEEEAEQNESV